MLSDLYARGRDNNFNLLRLSAALLVLYSHSFALSGAASTQIEAVSFLLGRDSGGAVAVDAFFLMSGFLVSGSMIGSGSLIAYIRSRALRIMPALIVVVLVCAFVLGPIVTALPLTAYLLHPQTWRYVTSSLTFYRLEFSLPGVFTHLRNASPNGSLWTLPQEVRLYVLVAALWVVGVLQRPKVLLAFLLVVGLIILSRPELAGLPTFTGPGARCGAFFAVGMLAFAFRKRLPVDWRIAVALLVVAGITRGRPGFLIAYGAALSYGLLWLAYVPVFRAFNRVGDYSYGVYLYAFPVQQTLVWLAPQLKPLELFASALPLTLIFAVLSWHLVEKRALALAKRRRAALITPDGHQWPPGEQRDGPGRRTA